MNVDKRQEQTTIDKFRLLYAHTQGGIFSQKTRERIMTKRGLSGRSKTINTFWYRQRENVKTALIDFRLFIEEAGESHVNQVVTPENIESIVSSLLLRPTYEKAEPNLKRAEIAKLFIKAGFEYLTKMQSKYVSLSNKNSIDEALDTTNFLVELFRANGKRRYVFPYDRPSR